MRRSVALYCAMAAFLVAASQLTSFWDEGFHLVAAKAIGAGMAPYRDFFYQQPPGYATANAWWMRIFGETWRSAHVFSALLTSGAAALAGGFVYRRLACLGWGPAGGAAAAAFLALSVTAIRFGTIAEPYALCLFLTVGSFRLATRAVDGEGGAALASGFCAGAATACSFLCAPAAPVLLGWLYVSGRRWRQCGLFLLGAAVPGGLALRAALRAPGAAWFDMFQYHLYYRAGREARNLPHVAAEWLRSPQNVLLIVLAAVGLLLVFGSGAFDERRRAEFRLCAWMAAAFAAPAAFAHPTFPQYFIFSLPFLAIPAAVGVCAIGSRIWTAGRPGWLAALAVAFFSIDTAQWVRAGSETGFRDAWSRWEQIGQLASRVTPPGGLVYAHEVIFFAAKRLPPSGLENDYATRMELPAALAASIHAVPHREWIERLKDGWFDTAAISFSEISAEDLAAVSRLYGNSRKVDDGHGWEQIMFWNRLASHR